MYWNHVNEFLPPMERPCFLWDGRRMWIGARVVDPANCVWTWSNCYGDIAWESAGWDADHTIDKDYQPTHWMPLPSAPRFMTDAEIFSVIENGANGGLMDLGDDSELAEALALLRIRLPDDTSPARIRAVCCQLLEARGLVENMLSNIPRHCRLSGVGPALFSNHPLPPGRPRSDVHREREE